jgi:plastocyanin
MEMPPSSRFTPVVLALAVVLAAVALVPAGAGSASTPKKARVVIRCKNKFKVNRYFQEGCRFAEDSYKIRAGGTITIDNRSDEPHTFSLVKGSQLPRNLRQAEKCFEGACGALAQAHGFPEGEGPPANPLVNLGATGFDSPGDSVFFDPKTKTNEQITAKKGQTLYFLCIIHPQMQSRIAVK